jgi:hypothetical protein
VRVCRALCWERYPSKCPADSAGVGAACVAIADGVVDPDESALLFAAFYADDTCSKLQSQQFHDKNKCFETSGQNSQNARTHAHSLTFGSSIEQAPLSPDTRAARFHRSLCFDPPCASVRLSACACVCVFVSQPSTRRSSALSGRGL